MKIVTISRQAGSYGDEIAAIVAARVGLQLVGRQELHELALSCDSEYSDVCNSYETEYGPGFFERLFLDKPTYRSLYEALTFEQAAGGKVVILGRGANITLRGIPGVFRVRVVAPREIRVSRIVTQHKISAEAAEHFVRTKGDERESLIRSVFGEDLRNWALYDMILNTAIFSPEAAAKVVVQALESIEKVSDKENLREQLKDTALAKRIEALIRKKLAAYVARQVEVSAVAKGVMRISGRTPELKDKKRIEELVAEYPGVTKVENELHVTELSFGY